MAVCNFTRNIRMCLDIFELRIENKKQSVGKTVLIIRSQICEPMAFYIQQMALKNSAFISFYIYVLLLFCTLKNNFWTKTAILLKIWDYIQKQFNPPWGQLSKDFFLFQKQTPPLSEMLYFFRMWHLKDIEEKNHGFVESQAIQVTIFPKVRKCLAFLTKWVGNHFYRAKWTLLYINVYFASTMCLPNQL